MKRQNLIYQEGENVDGMVYNLELLDNEQNWAYLRETQMNQMYQEMDAWESAPPQDGQIQGKGKRLYLAHKDKAINAASNTQGDEQHGSKDNAPMTNFDRLRGILDSDDPRVERLQKESIKHLEQGVAALSSNMGLAIDQFYAKTNETYREIRHLNIFQRESEIPQANVEEICPEMIDIVKAPWQFGNLPGVYSRVPKLVQEPQLLEKLQKKLAAMKPMEFWNEPVECMPQPSESFFHTIEELLGLIAAKDLDKMHPNDRNDLQTLQSNAVQSVFGLAVLSGSFEMIVQALDTIHDFTKKAKPNNVEAVFTQCKPALETYLEQIREVANSQRDYHMMHGDNISAVFGSQIKIYPNSSLTKNNTSITSDGTYVYLIIGLEKVACMYKIGTGFNGTLAGSVYLSVRSKKEGNLTWAYCQGKLYMRRGGPNALIPHVQVIDPQDFRVVGELILDLESQFKEQKELLRRNRNFPLISDGEHLYAVIMTVEKRDRAIKEEHKEKAAALVEFKKNERQKQKQEKKEAKEKIAAQDKASDKTSDEKKKDKKMFKLSSKPVDEVDFFHGQQYFVAVFKAIKFDISKTKETVSKEPETHEIDFLSMTEAQLFDMPIVHEMFETFSGFYNIKRCAVALQHNNDDIHDASEWLIQEHDAPFFRAYALKQVAEVEKKKPPTLVIDQEFLLSESILKTSWNEASKDNPEITTLQNLLFPECLECGKWTINGDQMTYHTDYRSSVANLVFSLNAKDQSKSLILKEQETELQKASFERAKSGPESQPSDHDRVPKFAAKRRGPGEEDLPADIMQRVRQKFDENDPEKTDNIGMESFGLMISELELANEEDDEAMEEAFDGLDLDERDTMRFEEFHCIARRLYFRKKAEEDRKKMANISEEQLEIVFHRYMQYNQRSEEDCLTERGCYDALRKLRIKMNPQEYTRKFNEFDSNNDRHINLEEFRRFLGKEQKEQDEKKKASPQKRKKLHVSNLVFFYDSIEWISYSPQEVAEGTHSAAKESKRSEIAKKSPEKAESYDWITEWSLYENIEVRSTKIIVEAEKGSQLQDGPFYVTYDKQIGKFICFSLTHSHNFFFVDNLTETIPRTFGEAPPTSIASLDALTETVLNLMAWVNERRFSMPWRWSLWSQTFNNVLKHLENGNIFLSDLYVEVDQRKTQKDLNDEAQKNLVKRIKKRLQIFKEREITKELYRLDQPIANNEQAIAYRAKKVQKERSKNVKKTDEESKCAESICEIEEYVLPLEKIYLAQENRKLYAYCTIGNERVVRLLFSFLKNNPKNATYYRAFLDALIFADQLLAYHDPELMSKIREFLIAQIATASQEIRQYIWRSLVVGWYKLASNAEHQLSLLKLFVENSKTQDIPDLLNGGSSDYTRWLYKLLDVQHLMTPIELFNHRFFSTPEAFFFFEMIQISKVGRYHVCLKSEELFDPKLVTAEPKEADKASESQSQSQSESKNSNQLNLSMLNSSVLSTTMVLDGPTKKPVSFRNKSKVSLLSNYHKLLDCPQVNQSLTKVPLEYVVLHNLKSSDDPVTPVTDSYFAMPLYQLFNEEMINFDSPDLPKDDLEFLCQRYSDEKALDSEDNTPKERKDVWFQNLIQLRESNKEVRQNLTKTFMNAIVQSQSSEKNADYSWDDKVSPAMMNVLRKLLDQGFAILKVHNPRHVKGTVDMLGLIDQAFKTLQDATESFKSSELSPSNIKWLSQIKQLLLTVVMNVECNLGYVMQTEIAVHAVPLLVSIFDRVRHLFIKSIIPNEEENSEKTAKVIDILTSLATLNIEGTDPTSYCNLESVHPLPSGAYQVKESYRVPRAIGYMIEFDPMTAKSNAGSIHLRTSRSEHEIHPGDTKRMKSLVLVGSSLSVRFSSNERDPKSWGFKLTIKPIVGKPQLVVQDEKSSVKELETLLTTTNSQLQENSHTHVTSWLNLLNHIVFVISFMTRGLQDSDLISQQTNGRLKNGAGIFNNFGKSTSELEKLAENDQTLNYALPIAASDEQETKVKPYESETTTIAEIDKKQITEWQLFKSGLLLPQMENKSAYDCVLEGLRLISSSLLRRQDLKIQSLQEIIDQPDQKEVSESDKAKQRSNSLIRRKTTKILKEETSSEFQGRKEVWPEQVIQLLEQPSNGKSKIQLVLDKMRSGIGPYSFGYTSIWRVPSAKTYEQIWTKAQQLFVAAVMYHSNLIGDCEAFVKMADDKVRQIADRLKEHVPEILTGDDKIIYQVMLIRQKVDQLLSWMKNRLDGQKYWNHTVKQTVEKAKDLLEKAVDKHRQDQELTLMRQAEDETRAFNKLLAEQEKVLEEAKQIQLKKEEEEKKVDLDKKQKPKSSAGKVRSSAPSGMRRNQRGNVQRLARAMPKAQPQKKSQPVRDSAPAVIGNQSPLVTAAPKESEEESKQSESNKELQNSTEQEKKVIEIEFLELTEQELANVKKEIYDEGFKLFEEFYGGQVSQLSTFFDIESDSKDKTQTLRAIYKNIKTRLVNYIDFDVPEMPIPAKYDDKMINLKNPHEEIAMDIINRLSFLFEVKPSNNYLQEVSSQISIQVDQQTKAGFGQLKFTDDKSGQKTQAFDEQKQIKIYSKLSSENPKDLKDLESSPLQAIYVFAKCSRLSNMEFLRNLMLDQLYLANFSLYSLQNLMQLNSKIGPTIFSRFVQGSVSYSVGKSTMDSIQTCGSKTMRLINAVSREFIESNIKDLVGMHDLMVLMEKEIKIIEQEVQANEKSQTAQIKVAAPKQPPLQQVAPGQFNFSGMSFFTDKNPFQKVSEVNQAQMQAKIQNVQQERKDHAIAKHLSKKAYLDGQRLIESQRKMNQALNDIRVLLSNVYTKGYFLESLSRADSPHALDINSMSEFFRVIIHHIVSAQSVQDNDATCSPTSSDQSKKTGQGYNIMRSQLADVSRTILDLMLVSTNNGSASLQQQLIEVALEIVIELLEKVCYEKKEGSDEVFVNIDDCQHKDEYTQLLTLFSELSRGSSDSQKDKQIDQVQKAKVTRSAQLLANLILHVQVPEVMRLAVKCAKVYLQKVDLKEVKILRVSSATDQNPEDFLTEALRKIGALISNSDLKASKPVQKELEKVTSAENNGPSGDSVKVGESKLEYLLNQYTSTSQVQVANSDKEYFVYTNLNSPNEEDFTFIVTALWHWYQSNPFPNLKLVTDPADITIEAPPPSAEEEKKAAEDSEKKPEDGEKPKDDDKPKDGEKPKEEEKKAEAPGAEEEKKAEEVPVAQEEKKAEVPVVKEEKKAEVQEEEKKGEPDAPEEEKKEPTEEEKQRLADEAKLKQEEELKEKERKELEAAVQKEKDLLEQEAMKCVIASLREVTPDFNPNESWIEMIKNFKPQPKSESQKKKEQELLVNSAFAPSLKQIISCLKEHQQVSANDYIKESNDTPKKLIELKQILKLIIDETYKEPTTNDSEEIKQQKMKEANFNSLLMAVMGEAVKIATAMTQRRSVAIAGPFSLAKAHQLTQILNRAYSKSLTSVPINPFMKEELQEKKVKFREWEISAKEIMPITDEKVRIQCGKPSPKSYFTKFTINIAPREMKVTICEKQTAAELESELLKRGQIEEMDFKQVIHTGSRSGGSLSWIGMPQPQKISNFKSFVQPMGLSIQAIIQELIQLVRSLITDAQSKTAQPKTPRRKSVLIKTVSESQELSENSLQKEFVVKTNSMFKRVAQSAQWRKDFSNKEKQIILGLISIIGGWQPCLAIGQLVQIESSGSQVNKAIVTDQGFGHGQVSVIQLQSDDVKMSQVDSSQVKPIFNAYLDLSGVMGRSLDTSQLYAAIMSLKKQAYDKVGESALKEMLEADNQSASDLFFSAEHLLVMLLKVTMKMPNLEGSQSSSMRDLIQALIQISDIGREDCEQEGKPQAFWELDLAKQWARLIDNSQEGNTNFYLPREYYQSLEQANEDSDSQVLADLGMQELMKRASTSITENRFVDVEFVQNKNHYLTGLEQNDADQKENPQETAKTRKIKFFVDNVLPRAADVVSIDAYRGEHHRIQGVLVNVKHMLCFNWKMGIDELKYACNGSQINFPDQNWDWSVCFFDEIVVDSWAKAKLRYGIKKVRDEDDDEADEKQDNDAQTKIGVPLLDKLLDIGIEEILVQIKAIEYKRHCFLAEYTDVDSMTKHWIWFPIAALKNINSQMEPAAISFLSTTVNKKFKTTLQNTAIAYARQSLLKIVHELQSDTGEAQSLFKMPVDNLKLHDIISWALWEKFASSPVIGWMKEMRQVILPKEMIEPARLEEIKRIEKSEKLNEEEAGVEIRKIFNEVFEDFSSIQPSSEALSDETALTSSGQAETLQQVNQTFEDLISSIGSGSKTKGTEANVALFKQLVDECLSSWQSLTDSISSEKAVIDICKEFERLKQMKSESQNQSANTLPLHEMMPCKGKNAINTTIMFKRGGTKITPGSKVKFYSDPDQINLLKEIAFVRNQQFDKEPIRMPSGKVWVTIEQSMDIDILQEDEIVLSPKLEFAIFQVPKEWTVVCWLTETITSSLLKDNSVNSTKFSIEIFEKFMQAIMTFYSKANAPGLLKSVALTLVSRLIVKLRFLYHQLEKAQALTPELESKSHLEKLFIRANFIQNLIDDAQTYMKKEEEELQNQNKANLLYPSIVQDAAELLMNIAVPTKKTLDFQAGSELLSTGEEKLELPEWSQPLLNVSHFLHFFRGEANLPQKLLDEVFKKTTRTHFQHQLDNVIVVRKVPSSHARYTRRWIIERVIDLLTMHQARIIDPQKDIYVMPDEEEPNKYHSIVIFMDEFSYWRPNDKNKSSNDESDVDDDGPKIVPLYVDSDEEKDGEAEKPEGQAEQPDEKPAFYNCGNIDVCGGFENDIDNSTCVVCDSPRPPMDELIEAFKAKKKADKAAEKAAAAVDVDSEAEEGEPLHHLRLKKLQKDIRHVISHDQRLIALQRLEESKQAKQEEEARLKEEAEKAKAAGTDESSKAKEDEKEKPKEEEKKAEPDSDDSPEEEKPMVDLDNLPEDLRERCRLLEIDESLIEEGEDLIAMFEGSAIEEMRKQQERRLTEQTERRKRRKAKEDAKKAAELKKQGNAEEVIKLSVSIMKSETYEGDSKVKETLSSALKARSSANTDQFDFTNMAKSAITKMHKLFQSIDLSKLTIPSDIEDKLADFGIRKETLKSNTTEDVIAKMKTIVQHDPIAFTKLLVSQGFDLWFTQACFPVCDLKKSGLPAKDLRDVDLLFKVRQLVESDFCKGRAIVNELDPALLRLIHTIEDKSERKDFSSILNKGDTTDEEELKATKENEEGAEEEKKGEPDEDQKEEEKKEVVEEEEKKSSEDLKKEQEEKAKRKALKEEKLKSVKEKLQKMRLATIIEVWAQDAASSKLTKSFTDEQKSKLDKVKSVLQKPKKNKIVTAWKTWSKKHANDRKLTWEQTLQSTQPISCFNDISVKDTYAELLGIFNQAQLRFVWAFVRIFNKNYSKTIRFINQTSSAVAIPEKAQPMSISAYLNSAKNICLSHAKNDLRQLIVNRTAIPATEDDTNLPRIVFRRLKDASDDNAEDSQQDKVKAKPSFLQAFEQLKNIDVSKMRQPKPHGSLPHLAFRAVFKGEDVEGDGGPYRQVFQDWSSQLQPQKTEGQQSTTAEILDLLKPCANQVEGEQIGKDRFVVNSSNNSSKDLQKYQFLGILMGVCVRTGVIFSLDLPRMFWKQLTGQKVTLDDIVEVEWRFLRSSQQMLSYSREDFQVIPQYWTTTLADSNEIDLTEDGEGADTLVKFEERFDYIRQSLKARLTQTQEQMQAIRRGLCQIIPESMLNIANLDDLETWICGDSKPNIDLLRRHTEYPKDEPDYAKDSPLIKNFWKFLNDISDEDRKKFVIFCWGQQRLPPNDAAYAAANILFKIKKHSGKDRKQKAVNMDDCLPTASTCFFQFTLPKYSSIEHLSKKILIAVHYDCIGMNAEVRQNQFHDRGGESEEEE